MSIWPGLAHRRALTQYLAAVALIMAVLLAVALTLDFAAELQRLQTLARARGLEWGGGLAGFLLVYAGHRSVDIITNLLPVACLGGVFLAEVLRRRRLEAQVLEGAGASPWRGMAPVLSLALLLAPVQMGLDGFLRPWAVFAQVDLDAGRYARRYGQIHSTDGHWFLAENLALHAASAQRNPPELRDVMVYRDGTVPRLVITAPSARPGSAPGRWVLDNPRFHGFDADLDDAQVTSGPLELTLPLYPDGVRYLNVPASFLPGPALRQVTAQASPRTAADAATERWRRWLSGLLPGAFALLGLSLSQAGFPGRRANAAALLFLGATGYLSVFSVKMFWSLGGLARMTPLLAASAGALIALALVALLQWRRL